MLDDWIIENPDARRAVGRALDMIEVARRLVDHLSDEISRMAGEAGQRSRA